MKIWIKMKDNPSVSKLIEESDFNIETVDKVEVSNDKLKDMFKSKAAPGISTNSGPSITYNNKLDSGAIGDYLDTTLDGAKKRAIEREKTGGNAFKKHKVPIRRKKD